MAKSRATATHGTAQELAGHDDSYAANGESQHSRRAASPPGNLKTRGYVKKGQGERPPGQLLAESKSELARMCGRLIIGELDAAQRAKLKHNIEVKRGFIARLEAEVDDINSGLGDDWN